MHTNNKINCWEYMKCGRSPEGEKASELGVCPASVDDSYDGINSGKCGGRFCWAVAGTLCGGKVQGTFAEKRESCVHCDFYKRVQAEQGTANLRTKFLRFVNPDVRDAIFDASTYKHIKCGERFISQGDLVDTPFIIHRGACVELVEKDGILHPVGHRGEGDVVGMMSALTGEPMNMHVEAETDMDVWVIDKARFTNMPQNDPDLYSFLTELVVDRFDSKRPTADRTIGKYIAMDIIGRGGNSIVYKGVNSDLNMPVAIKMMRHNLAMHPDFLENFRNEAKIIAGLNHENIIRVFDIEERYQTLFIITEYLEGESLYEMLKRLKSIPPLLVASYIYQLCAALVHAGQKGLIHRDINPKNIIAMKNDRIKLIDFGLACPSGTEDHHFGGEFAYLAPEIFDGEPANERTDIYALGITAYELITGEKPFTEKSPDKLMNMIRNHGIHDPAEKNKHIPKVLRNFILDACRRNPLERYQNVLDVVNDISPLVRKIFSNRNRLEFSGTKKLTLFLKPDNNHKADFDKLIEDFSRKIKDMGGDIKVENG